MRQVGVGRAEALATETKGKALDKRNTTFLQPLFSTDYVFAVENCLEMWPNYLLAKWILKI